MTRKRVRPEDIGRYNKNVKLLNSRRQKEIRVPVYIDMYDLINIWGKDHGVTTATVMRKLVNYFILMSDKRKEYLIKNF